MVIYASLLNINKLNRLSLSNCEDPNFNGDDTFKGVIGEDGNTYPRLEAFLLFE